MAMSMPPRQAPSMEQFEAYFQRADLDRDGRISGAEAVAFFQGSNLPKNVLAQIWAYSDRTNSGFLGREEFYNALRLVTVAQSGRGLTRDIVKAALEGPAAAKIPLPQIRSVGTPNLPGNTMPTQRPQLSSMMPSPVTGIRSGAPSSAHNIAFQGTQGQVLPIASTNQQGIPSSALTGALQATPSALPVQSVPQGLPGGGSLVGPGNQNTNVASKSTDWFSTQPTGQSTGGTSQVVGRVVTPAMKQDVNGSAPLSTALVPVATATQSNVAAPLSSSLQHTNKDAQALVPTGNGFSSNSIIGGDMFAAAQPQGKASGSSASAAFQPSTVAFKSVASSSVSTGLAVGAPLAQPLFKQDQPNSLPRSSIPPSGIPTPTSGTTQSQWRKMTQPDIQRYTKIFVEVDRDRDGKITGDEARNLFLSWGLPREILKQVWDLSDQDSDSMLSMREFCIALYLMERFREGSPLPAALPNSIKFDEVLLQATSHPVANYGGQTWQPSPGFHQHGMSQTRPALPASAVRTPLQSQMPSQSVADMRPPKKKSAVPVLEKQLVDQLSNEEQTALNAKLKEATDADTKVQGLEKEIMDYKEKNEFYRTKMQELVLYKSRCDTRLNEVIERASADKRELELLSKKYEEKCKQKGDVASKLTIEEATFRDIQERKLEIYKAIAKLNQDGSTDGSLQSVAEKVQSDLEDLVKTLNDQCKTYGLRTKPTTLVELPFGWQPGINEGSADWDENWDKFDEEGFTLVKDLTIDVENIISKPKSKLPTASGDTKPSKKELSSAATSDVMKGEKSLSQEGSERESVFSQNEDAKSPKQSSLGKEVQESLSPKFDSKSPKQSTLRKEAFEISSPKFDAQKEEELLRSPPQSSPGKGMSGSPSKFSSTRFGLNDTSPRVSDQHRNQGVQESNMIGDNHNDTSLWGPSFDAHDDNESIWGFDSIDQGAGHDRGYDSFFGSGDFGLNPIKTETPSAASQYKPSSIFADSVPATPQYKPSSVFADSVPATPQYSSSFSPRYGDGLESFDSFGPFGRFDSFSNPTTLTRFDSMRSSTSEVSGFFSQNDSQLARFDSIRSTRDSETGQGFTSFDDADPFGTGPFKSSGTETPKQTYDNWRAF